MEKIITMHRKKENITNKARAFFARKKQLTAAVVIVVAFCIAMPGARNIFAQKIIPSVQSQNNHFVSDKAEVEAAGGQIPTKQVSPSSTNTYQNTNGWRGLRYEQLVNYTPTAQVSGEYITILLQRTAERYREVSVMDLTHEEKVIVARNIRQRTSKQLNKVEKIVNQYIKTLSLSI